MSELKAIKFNKSHSVGAHIPCATSQRSKSAMAINPREDSSWKKPFISPPSIPNVHVPRPILRRMLRMEYFGTTIPRHSSLS